MNRLPIISYPASGLASFGADIWPLSPKKRAGLKLYYYNIAEKKLTVRNFLYFDKVLDFSFSDEGSKFVFAGTRIGKTDIYVHDIASSTNEQITNDLADDIYPRFIENDSKIIFSSNRMSDTLER